MKTCSSPVYDSLRSKLAAHVVETEVRSGMTVVLGTGRMSAHVMLALGAACAAGRVTDLRVLCTSLQTEQLAAQQGLAIRELGALDFAIDLGIDGADEVDKNKNMIKGLGAAAFRERYLELRCRRLCILVEKRKLKTFVGEAGIPVEIAKFGHLATLNHFNVFVQDHGFAAQAQFICDATGAIVSTDNGNYLALLQFAAPAQLDQDALARLETLIREVYGVFDHGLFLGLQPVVYSIDDASNISSF